MDSNDPWARLCLATAYLRKSMYAEAIDGAQNTLAIRDGPRFLAQLGQAYALADRKSEALEVLNQLQNRASDHFSLEFVELYIALGKKDDALALLEKGFEKRDEDLLYIKCSTVPDSLRDNPRFKDLLNRINFPELNFELDTRK